MICKNSPVCGSPVFKSEIRNPKLKLSAERRTLHAGIESRATSIENQASRIESLLPVLGHSGEIVEVDYGVADDIGP
jgi:hypothetical protein